VASDDSWVSDAAFFEARGAVGLGH
jgi:hypothetical protein